MTLQRLPFAILVLLTLAPFNVLEAKQTPRCKCTPGSECFPSQDKLSEFSKTLTHPLIQNQRPFAAPCYSNSKEFNPTLCSSHSDARNDHLLLTQFSNALQVPNFEALVNGTTVLECPFDPAPNAVCHQGRVPQYSVNVSSVKDIQETLRFVQKNNLRLVVKNTGHELMGRAFGSGSIELFTHNLQSVNFEEAFVPEGAPRGFASEIAITAGAGVQWNTLYSVADAHNRSIAGGFSVGGSVGAAAGWVLGGGHSVLSPFFGLGVDNVLQFTVVLPNSSFVTVNQFKYPDLFWALRGGGGPSFGIVTSTTYRTHPNFPYTVAFYEAFASSEASFLALLQTFLELHNPIADAGWTGIWPFANPALFLTFFSQGSPESNPIANKTMEEFFAKSKAIDGVTVALAMTVQYRSFQAWNQDNLIDSSKGFGLNFSAVEAGLTRLAESSWLMPRSLTSPANASMLAPLLVNLTGAAPFLVGGGQVAKVPVSSASVTPAWRTAVSDMVVNVAFNDTLDATVIQNIQTSTHQMLEPIRKLAPVPQGGQYLNEPDALEPDWQQAYWGANYPLLLALKKEIDPFDLLLVAKGVNSEGWDAELLCRVN